MLIENENIWAITILTLQGIGIGIGIIVALKILKFFISGATRKYEY